MLDLQTKMVGTAKATKENLYGDKSDKMGIVSYTDNKDGDNRLNQEAFRYNQRLSSKTNGGIQLDYAFLRNRVQDSNYWLENLYGKTARKNRGMGGEKVALVLTDFGYTVAKTDEESDIKVGFDNINAIGPVKLYNKGSENGKAKGEEELNFLEPFASDFIRFRIYDVVNDIALPFRATIKDYSDSFSAEFSSIQYIGRPDQVYVYKGFSRKSSFSFIVHIGSPVELEPTWQKINYLAGLCYPADYVNNSVGMVGPLTKITIGDMVPGYYALINSVSIKPIMNSGWGTGKQRQLPRHVEIGMEVQFLHTSQDLPRTISPHFGDLSMLRLYDIDTIKAAKSVNKPIQSTDYFSPRWAGENRLKVSNFTENIDGGVMGDRSKMISRLTEWNDTQNKLAGVEKTPTELKDENKPPPPVADPIMVKAIETGIGPKYGSFLNQGIMDTNEKKAKEQQGLIKKTLEYEMKLTKYMTEYINEMWDNIYLKIDGNADPDKCRNVAMGYVQDLNETLSNSKEMGLIGLAQNIITQFEPKLITKLCEVLYITPPNPLTYNIFLETYMNQYVGGISWKDFLIAAKRDYGQKYPKTPGMLLGKLKPPVEPIGVFSVV